MKISGSKEEFLKKMTEQEIPRFMAAERIGLPNIAKLMNNILKYLIWGTDYKKLEFLCFLRTQL